MQFAAGGGYGAECPKGSVYGHVKAWTPLLDEPLKGPVYLRSSNHNLPDAVFALHGLVDIEVAVRIDSVHGGLRAIVDDAPDAPVARAVVRHAGRQEGPVRQLAPTSARASTAPGSTPTARTGGATMTKPVVRAVKCKKAPGEAAQAPPQARGRRWEAASGSGERIGIAMAGSFSRASALVGAACFALCLLPAASAAAPATLWTKCPSGSAAGRCNIPRGIAADPTSGHLYVADQSTTGSTS